jgi:hypothetical protein
LAIPSFSWARMVLPRLQVGRLREELDVLA